MDISVVWEGKEAYVKPGCGMRPRVCPERIFQDTVDSVQSVRLRTYYSQNALDLIRVSTTFMPERILAFSSWLWPLTSCPDDFLGWVRFSATRPNPSRAHDFMLKPRADDTSCHCPFKVHLNLKTFKVHGFTCPLLSPAFIATFYKATLTVIEGTGDKISLGSSCWMGVIRCRIWSHLPEDLCRDPQKSSVVS